MSRSRLKGFLQSLHYGSCITQTLLRPGNILDIQTGPSSVPYLDPLRGSKHLLQDDLDDQRSSC